MEDFTALMSIPTRTDVAMIPRMQKRAVLQKYEICHFLVPQMIVGPHAHGPILNCEHNCCHHDHHNSVVQLQCSYHPLSERPLSRLIWSKQ